jgi:hypothetical protein
MNRYTQVVINVFGKNSRTTSWIFIKFDKKKSEAIPVTGLVGA